MSVVVNGRQVIKGCKVILRDCSILTVVDLYQPVSGQKTTKMTLKGPHGYPSITDSWYGDGSFLMNTKSEYDILGVLYA
jgi:hypothetical protein